MQPSPSLLAQLRAELERHPPFDRMEAGALDTLLAGAQQLYFAPGELILEPASGPVQHLYWVRQGAVTALREAEGAAPQADQHEPGDLFPIGAVLAQRPARSRYTATQDTFLLAMPLQRMREVAAASAPFNDFLQRRLVASVERSGRALQQSYASTLLAQQSLEAPLAQVARAPAVTCQPDAPLREALGEMHARRIGSILVRQDGGPVLGILTRHDILGRVALPGVSLDAPVRTVMTQPVHTLTTAHTAQDAVLLMSRHGIRHVPVTGEGDALYVVSERDLFALQRTSLKHVGSAIRAAPDLDGLVRAAAQVRQFTRSLLGQGVQARQTTTLVSHLNDTLTRRLLELEAARHGLVLARACWLALGSEGRGEQTIVTDQDNALLLPDAAGADERAAWLAFGRAVNLGLDACGFPLCKGGVMAGEPDCCKTLDAWRDGFMHWMEHGTPEDLLNASIYFDFRPLAGEEGLALQLREEVLRAAARLPRFQKLLALNALERSVPLDWRGAIDTEADGCIDLKLRGAAIFVDAARTYALACGIAATNTRERLEAVAARLNVPSAEAQAWVAAFEFLQTLRLRVQLDPEAYGGQANRIAPAALNDLDRRTLKESLRLARMLQRRLALDYQR